MSEEKIKARRKIDRAGKNLRRLMERVASLAAKTAQRLVYAHKDHLAHTLTGAQKEAATTRALAQSPEGKLMILGAGFFGNALMESHSATSLEDAQRMEKTKSPWCKSYHGLLILGREAF